MNGPERLFSWLLGASFLLAAIDTVAFNRNDLPNVIVVCTTLFFALLALISWTREPIARHGTWFDCLAASPSIIIGFFIFGVVHGEWSWLAQVIFMIGFVIACTSFLYLGIGRSFAVMPAVRNVVSSGPYKLVRHPAYTGELLMLVGICLVSGDKFGLTALGFLLAIVFVAIRIQVEENLLRASKQEYKDYSERVRWRLVPFLW